MEQQPSTSFTTGIKRLREPSNESHVHVTPTIGSYDFIGQQPKTSISTGVQNDNAQDVYADHSNMNEQQRQQPSQVHQQSRKFQRRLARTGNMMFINDCNITAIEDSIQEDPGIHLTSSRSLNCISTVYSSERDSVSDYHESAQTMQSNKIRRLSLEDPPL